MTDSLNIPVTHIITGLDTGGAEIMLKKLLQAVDRDKYPSRVISLTTRGIIGEQIAALGVPVTAMGMRPGRISLADIGRLAGEIRDQKPDVVQTWMYHADLLGGLAARRVGVHWIAWNIRNSTLDWKKSKPSTLLTVSICSILSHFIPRKIVVCSQAAARVHQQVGYAGWKMRVIPNGFDLAVFKPDQETGIKQRALLGLNRDVPVVGLAARYDRQKDHETFFKSAAVVLQSLPDTHFLLCGEGITPKNPVIRGWAAGTGREEQFHLLGRWTDMPLFHAACDVEVSSSAYGESFSNVLGEAMACGIPCVSTRVGGAEEVLGETGQIVPPKNPEALGNAILTILKQPATKRQEMGMAGRERMLHNFDISLVAQEYSRVWNDMCNISA
ncbi:MAG: glycosyltransferase [Leptolinea sp.]|jgi:glycosyltransferase involved in cell wall biosynthesis|nr:glycosyltransferase [Leptolinea sp.]